jgi:hypothetical protein
MGTFICGHVQIKLGIFGHFFFISAIDPNCKNCNTYTYILYLTVKLHFSAVVVLKNGAINVNNGQAILILLTWHENANFVTHVCVTLVQPSFWGTNCYFIA